MRGGGGTGRRHGRSVPFPTYLALGVSSIQLFPNDSLPWYRRGIGTSISVNTTSHGCSSPLGKRACNLYITYTHPPMFNFLKDIYLNIYLLIYLAPGIFRSSLWHMGSLVLACRLFCCGMWDPVPQPRPLALKVESLSHWTTRDGPLPYTLNHLWITCNT